MNRNRDFTALFHQFKDQTAKILASLGGAQVASPMETCRTWKAKQVISEKIVNYVYKEEFD